MSVIIDFLRLLSSWIDLGLYSLAGFIYQVFCAVATSTIIESSDVQAFAERIYVVVGVFTLFKVGIAMLKYLVNPDQLTDSKVGYNKLIWNMMLALVLLLSVPTIYSYAMKAQTAILKSNIIAKVVLGKTGGATADFKDAGNSMIYTTLSAFVMPNYDVTDKDGTYVVLQDSDVQACFNTDANGKVKGTSGYTGIFTMNNGAVTGLTSACETAFDKMTDSDSKSMYLEATRDASIQKLLDVTVDAKLNDDIQEDAGRSGSFAAKLYFLKYMWGISWLVGAFLCFIFTTFAIDMAIRSIKLAFLILISPIPVLSMINPDKGTKGMLAEWWKITWATYLDLFLRIMSIFFVIFVIQQVDLTGTIAKEFGPVVSAFAMVFIIIGALLFAKQLPELVSKLIPGMDAIVKGGLNPLKKLGDTPFVGKPAMAGAAKLNAMRAQNRANKRLANQQKKNAAYDNAIKNGKGRIGAALAATGIGRAASGAQALKDQVKKDGAKATAKAKAKEALKSFKEAPGNAIDNLMSLHDDTRGVGMEAYDSTSLLGGDAKPAKYAAAAASINKKNRESIKNMQANSAAKANATAKYNKAKATAEAALEKDKEEKSKEIVEAQREIELQKIINEKYKTLPPQEARVNAIRDLQAQEVAMAKEMVTGKKMTEKGGKVTQEQVAATAEAINNQQVDKKVKARAAAMEQKMGANFEDQAKHRAQDIRTQNPNMTEEESIIAAKNEMRANMEAQARTEVLNEEAAVKQQRVEQRTKQKLTAMEQKMGANFEDQAQHRAQEIRAQNPKMTEEESIIAAKNEMRANMEAQARSAATSEVNTEMQNETIRNNEIEKRVQAKVSQNPGMSKETARQQATQEIGNMSATDIMNSNREQEIISEVNGMSDTDLLKQVDSSTLVKAVVANNETKRAISRGETAERATQIGKEAAISAEKQAIESVVGTVNDRMDSVVETVGVLYNNAEYADQVRITREAKDRRNSIQSEYEKAARQQQYEGKVTTADGRVYEGQEAINYVDSLRVSYTKASSDYDFMNEELKKMGEKYPEDAATRAVYEKEKDYQDKSKKINDYISKSSKVSNNEKEGAQYTVQDMRDEDILISKLRRAETDLANARTEFVTKQEELQVKRQILQSQIIDSQASGNAAETVRLQQELNVNEVELGRINTSIEAANRAANNINVNSNIKLDTRLEGVGNFDRVGTPIRSKIENIVNQMEYDVQRMNDVTLSAEERTRAKLAVDGAYKQYQDAKREAGQNIYSGMSNDTEKQIYDRKMDKRIQDIMDKKGN